MTNINWCSWINIDRKNIKIPVGQQFPYSIKWVTTILTTIHSFGARTIFYYFMIIKTMNLSHKEWILVWLVQYSPPKKLYGITMSILHKMGATYYGKSTYLWSFRQYPTILWSPRQQISVTKRGNCCSWTNSKPWKYHRPYWTMIYILHNMGENVLANIHIYGVRAMFLIFLITKTLNQSHSK